MQTNNLGKVHTPLLHDLKSVFFNFLCIRYGQNNKSSSQQSFPSMYMYPKTNLPELKWCLISKNVDYKNTWHVIRFIAYTTLLATITEPIGQEMPLGKSA